MAYQIPKDLIEVCVGQPMPCWNMFCTMCGQYQHQGSSGTVLTKFCSFQPPYPEWYHCGKTKSEITKLVEGSQSGDYAVYPKKDGTRLFFTLNDFGKAVRCEFSVGLMFR